MVDIASNGNCCGCDLVSHRHTLYDSSCIFLLCTRSRRTQARTYSGFHLQLPPFPSKLANATEFRGRMNATKEDSLPPTNFSTESAPNLKTRGAERIPLNSRSCSDAIINALIVDKVISLAKEDKRVHNIPKRL